MKKKEGAEKYELKKITRMLKIHEILRGWDSDNEDLPRGFRRDKKSREERIQKMKKKTHRQTILSVKNL